MPSATTRNCFTGCNCLSPKLFHFPTVKKTRAVRASFHTPLKSSARKIGLCDCKMVRIWYIPANDVPKKIKLYGWSKQREFKFAGWPFNSDVCRWRDRNNGGSSIHSSGLGFHTLSRCVRHGRYVPGLGAKCDERLCSRNVSTIGQPQQPWPGLTNEAGTASGRRMWRD